MPATDLLQLRALIKALQNIIEYLGAMKNREAFLKNPMAQDAVIRNFEILGASANRISPDFQSEHPQIPWSQLSSFLHTPLQAQYPIEPAILWEIGLEHLPQHLLELEAIAEQ
ncbi:MAG: HepT-like ribonuclease domain-containing protein [Bacteroidota bacterium]